MTTLATFAVDRPALAASEANLAIIGGSGGASSPPGPAGSVALSVGFNDLQAVTADTLGNLLMVDSYNNEVDILAKSPSNPGFAGLPKTWVVGSVYLLGGGGSSPVATTGLAATSVRLNSPGGVAEDRSGNVLVADTHDGAVDVLAESSANPGYVINGSWIRGFAYVIAGGGTVHPTVAGTAATGTSLSVPQGVSADLAGDVVIADTGHNEVEVLALASQNPGYSVDGWNRGSLYVVAGGGSSGPPAELGGPATQATLNGPAAVSIDAGGNVVIDDAVTGTVDELAVAPERPQILSASPSWQQGFLYVLAGGGSSVPSDLGGGATAVALNGPQGIAVDSVGDVLIADTFNGFVEVVAGSPANPGYSLSGGENWVAGNVYVIAGGGAVNASSMGTTAQQTRLVAPCGVAVGPSGQIDLVDRATNFLEELRLAPTPPTQVVATAMDGAVALGWGQSLFDGGSLVADYLIDVYAPGASVPVEELDSASAGRTSTVTGLADGTTYGFVIVAVNAIGPSFASEEVHATPLSEATPPPVFPPIAVDGTPIVMAPSSSATTAVLPAELPPSVRIGAGSHRVSRRSVTVSLTCTSADCVGAALLTDRHAVVKLTAHGRLTVIETSIVAEGRYSLVAPHVAKVALALTSFGRSATRAPASRGLAVTLEVTVAGGTAVRSAMRLLP